MNFEQDKEFIKYYIKNVLEDLKPMIVELSKTHQYHEIKQVFMNHINKVEFNKFCNLVDVDYYLIYLCCYVNTVPEYFLYKLECKYYQK